MFVFYVLESRRGQEENMSILFSTVPEELSWEWVFYFPTPYSKTWLHPGARLSGDAYKTIELCV